MSKMTIPDMEQLIADDKIEIIIENLEGLEKDEYQNIIEYLLNTIETVEDDIIRNSIAYLLGEIKCDLSCKSLVNLIFKPELKDNRGTLISALGKLECIDYTEQLLPLLYEGNFEVQMNIYSLLKDNLSRMDTEKRKRCMDILKKKINDYEEILDILYDAYENIFGGVLEE